MSNAFAIRSKSVVLPGKPAPVPATLVIKDGKFSDIIETDALPSGMEVKDFGDLTILPGIVDCHAHINEPGRTEWEGFETATKACAAGGITTVVDMPLNSIPATTSLSAFEEKQKSAHGKCFVDYGFWGGVVPGNKAELQKMVQAGILGFKCFLIESGVDEFKFVTKKDLLEAMPVLKSAGVPLLVHAELEGPAPADDGRHREYQNYLESRPREWENKAVQLMLSLCKETGCRTHIVHLSSSDVLGEIRGAKKSGLPFTVETCPHYLSLTSEEIESGHTHFKCAPPIREKENQDKLWTAVKDLTIDFIVSDHSPCTPQLKLLETGDFSKAWGGIASIQFSLSVIWTQMKSRGMTLHELTKRMCENTAKFAGLESKKGSLAQGKDADFVIFDPNDSFILEENRILHRHKLTPYKGRKLSGVVHSTWLRGQQVYDKNTVTQMPHGHALLRGKNV